ncbi:hypothetical protein HK100_007416 [Physocladia obscura]|uniref:SGNH hydrolase-type esterase domain-containing protein n=1 Tax=Physocladia obscura TaxID=109957 RepID=A0AAD5TC20_9FUNG|nr:hypothetical protein HK100_007416 [Physocladia obscura]
MTIFLGANDSAIRDLSPRQHVSVPDYKKHIHAILDIVRAVSPATKIILITPPPLDEDTWTAINLKYDSIPGRTAEHTRLYRDACIVTGQEARQFHGWGNDLAVIDTWELFLGRERMEKVYAPEDVQDFYVDGLHFGQKGNQALAEAILKTIKNTWPELHPDSMQEKIVSFHLIGANDNLPSFLFHP